jgi:hypothetical protein
MSILDELANSPLLFKQQASDGTLAGLCTSAIVNDYAQCYDCFVSQGLETQTSAQGIVDGASSPSCREIET